MTQTSFPQRQPVVPLIQPHAGSHHAGTVLGMADSLPGRVVLGGAVLPFGLTPWVHSAPLIGLALVAVAAVILTVALIRRSRDPRQPLAWMTGATLHLRDVFAWTYFDLSRACVSLSADRLEIDCPRTGRSRSFPLAKVSVEGLHAMATAISAGDRPEPFASEARQVADRLRAMANQGPRSTGRGSGSRISALREPSPAGAATLAAKALSGAGVRPAA